MKTALAIIIVIIVIAGGYLLFARKAQAPTAEQNPATQNTGNSAPLETTNPAAATTATNPPAAGHAVTVTFTANGFSPKTVNVKKGDTVMFVNSSSEQMWVASNPHPIHSGYSGTTVDQHCPDTQGVAFDECTAVGAGGTYSFTFQKVGSWGYHNHIDHGMTGTVVVSS